MGHVNSILMTEPPLSQMFFSHIRLKEFIVICVLLDTHCFSGNVPRGILEQW